MAAHDRLRWPSSLAGGVIFAVALMGYSLERLRHAWIIPGDIWYVTAAAHYVQNGALGYLYSAGPHYDALPLSAIFLAPVVAIGDRLRLTQGYPLPVHHATMWLLLGFAVHHVYSSMLMSTIEANATVESIFSGYKFVPREDLEYSGYRFINRRGQIDE